MLQIEAPRVGAPDQAQVRRVLGRRPCHHNHKTRGSRRLCARGSRSTSTSTSVPRTIGVGPRLPRLAWARTFGCKFAQARTRTAP